MSELVTTTKAAHAVGVSARSLLRWASDGPWSRTWSPRVGTCGGMSIVYASSSAVETDLARRRHGHRIDPPVVGKRPPRSVSSCQGGVVSSFSDARALAEVMLAEHLPDRWRHVQSVAREAVRIADIDVLDRDTLIQSAVLHDIGYSPVIARTGFHPLDGAQFLSGRSYDPRVTALVAHHSSAEIEADLRGITGLDRFDDEASSTRDALWYCDAVTGPQGQRLPPDTRWAEIRERYGPDHVVTRFLELAEPAWRAPVERTQHSHGRRRHSIDRLTGRLASGLHGQREDDWPPPSGCIVPSESGTGTSSRGDRASAGK